MAEDLKVRIPGSIMQELQVQAADQMLTVSDIVRRALVEHVRKTTTPTREEK